MSRWEWKKLDIACVKYTLTKKIYFHFLSKWMEYDQPFSFLLMAVGLWSWWQVQSCYISFWMQCTFFFLLSAIRRNIFCQMRLVQIKINLKLFLTGIIAILMKMGSTVNGAKQIIHLLLLLKHIFSMLPNLYWFNEPCII